MSLDDAQILVSGYVDHYNNVRLNSATGYITPKDMLAGRQQEIHAERDRKLEAARKQRQVRRHRVGCDGAGRRVQPHCSAKGNCGSSTVPGLLGGRQDNAYDGGWPSRSEWILEYAARTDCPAVPKSRRWVDFV